MASIGAALLLLLLPCSSECERALSRRVSPLLLCLLTGGLGLALFPRWLTPAVALWCAFSIALTLFRRKDALGSIMLWLLLSLCEAMLVLALCAGHWNGDFYGGVTDAVIRRLESSPHLNEYLVQAVQFGLARYDGPAPALSILGYVAIPDHARQQLLLSLRLSLRELLESYLPSAVGRVPLLISLLAGGLPELIRYQRRGLCDLPPFTEWRIGPSGRLCLLLSALTLGILSLDESVLALAMLRIGWAALSLVLQLNGFSALCWSLRRRGLGWGACCALGIVMFLLGGFLLLLLGVSDLLLPIRGAGSEEDGEAPR